MNCSGFAPRAHHRDRGQQTLTSGTSRATTTLAPPRSCPGCAAISSNLKAWLQGTFGGVTQNQMPRYLDEFTYRFNRRWCEDEFFSSLRRRIDPASGAARHRPGQQDPPMSPRRRWAGLPGRTSSRTTGPRSSHHVSMGRGADGRSRSH